MSWKFLCGRERNMIDHICVKITSNDVFLLFRLGNGVFSVSEICFALLVPRQFPLILEHVVLMTRKACVLRRNSTALGFSLTLPLCLCWPKNFSKGSWQRWLLRKRETSGREKRYRVSSTNELTTGKRDINNGIKFNKSQH